MKNTQLRTATIVAILCYSLVANNPQVWAQTTSGSNDSNPTMETIAEPVEVDLQEDPESLLIDRNGDLMVDVIAIGDSITRGVGDFTPANQLGGTITFPSGEAGYPLRVEQLLGIPVANLGRPGERFTTQILFLFAREIPARRADIVVISGGSNDAIDAIPVDRLGRAIQTAINISQAVGTQPVLAIPTPACCEHSQYRPFLDAYTTEYRTRAAVNEVPLVDFVRAFSNTCSLSSCDLLNRPEGLHPNSDGYDVMGEMVAATLTGVNLLEPNGPATLEAVLGLVPGSVQTVPNALPSNPAM